MPARSRSVSSASRRTHTLRAGLALGVCVLLANGLAAGEGPPAKALTQELDDAIARTVKALLAKQADDGGWHSETYGTLKPGIAQTAFALEALSRLPVAARTPHAQALAKSEAFLLAATGEDGSLGMKGEWPEYPVYSTSLAICAFARLKPDGWEKAVAKWGAWLKRAQYLEAHGTKPGDPVYGGWNPGGIPREGLPRHADLSTTRHALQALAFVEGAEAARMAAGQYVRSCQNLDLRDPEHPAGDGGFFFTTTQDALNKGGVTRGESGALRASYASATVDGLLCLIALDEKGDLPRRKAAERWVSEHFDVGQVEGVSTAPERKDWNRAMLFYYHASLAELASAQNPSLEWILLATATLKAQRPDGLFANAISFMKEDDPLIATPAALRTLLGCRATLTSK